MQNAGTGSRRGQRDQMAVVVHDAAPRRGRLGIDVATARHPFPLFAGDLHRGEPWKQRVDRNDRGRLPVPLQPLQ